MRIVLDTNVLVSGLLSPFGPPGKIVQMVAAGLVRLCVDARLLTEYQQVLLRPRFGFDPEAVTVLVDYIAATSDRVASEPLTVRLPDPDDEAFLEVAVASAADYLVTGNLKHYPQEARAGIHVVSPAAFIEAYRTAESPEPA